MRDDDKAKETKPVSFRLPKAVFDALQNKGVEKGLSPHEVASKIVQENYQEPIAIEAEVVKDTVTTTTGSKKLVLTEVSKQVFHFTLKELRIIHFAFSGCQHLPLHLLNVGVECYGITRIGEDLWEVVIETNALYK